MGLGGGFHTHQARALLAADPASDPSVVAYVDQLLVEGGTEVNHWEPADEHATEGPEVDPRQVDAVILVRSEPRPSRRLQAAARFAAAHDLPLYALVLPGVDVGLAVAEVLQVPRERPSPAMTTLNRLLIWSLELPRKHGHPKGGA